MEIRLKQSLFLLVICALILFLFGCFNPLTAAKETPPAETVAKPPELNSNSSNTGRLELYLTDFPLNDVQVRGVLINILRVEVHAESSGWRTIMDFHQTGGKTYDLLELIDDTALIGTAELEPGLYTQIRLLLGEYNHIRVSTAGSNEITTHRLLIPSGQQTGIKITGSFRVEPGYSVRLVLDFDAEKSIKHAKGKGFILTPTIKIKEISTIPISGVPTYIAGYYTGTYFDIASYWKDEASGKVDLSPTASSRASSVFVSADTVYAAGYYNNGSNDVACYWKDDGVSVTQVPLYTAANARANAIYVAGTTVYAAGYYNDGSRNVAGYWKDDGSPISWVKLYDASAAEATDIVVSSGVVYVSGFYRGTGRDVACYWQNGSKTDVEPTENSKAYAIAVSGSVVYTAGSYFLVGAGYRACYWQESTRTDLSPSNSRAWDIALSGSDVYVAGYYDVAAGNSAACYWLNNASGVMEMDLYKNASYTAQGRGIFLLGGDVYVAGYYNEGTQTACYWKNGGKTDLYSGVSAAYSMFVTN